MPQEEAAAWREAERWGQGRSGGKSSNLGDEALKSSASPSVETASHAQEAVKIYVRAP
jgi:hypothetical protein